MKQLKSITRFQAAVVVLALSIVTIASFGMALSSGVDEDLAQQGGGTLVVGCSCHNPEPSNTVQPILEGVPGVIAGRGEEVFNLTVRIEGGTDPAEGGMGGFNLHVSAGTLSVPEGDETLQITEGGDATHTRPSAARAWNVTWTAPVDDSEAVIFRLTVNAVNGNGQADPGDMWNRLVYVSQGADGATVGAADDHALHVETLGVNWLAYWVGIASFVFLFVILILYYFVFRYAETSHATDHRDRKKK